MCSLTAYLHTWTFLVAKSKSTTSQSQVHALHGPAAYHPTCPNLEPLLYALAASFRGKPLPGMRMRTCMRRQDEAGSRANMVLDKLADGLHVWIRGGQQGRPASTRSVSTWTASKQVIGKHGKTAHLMQH